MFTTDLKKEINLTLNLAIPIIVGQLGVVMMAITDNIMVGRFLGKIELGAAGIANSIAYLIGSLAIGGMSVVAPMVSKCAAENDHKALKDLFVSALLVALFFCFVLTGIGILVYYNFGNFQQSPIINQTAPGFFLYILASNIPLFLFLGLKQFADGLSKPKVAMVITAVGLVVNGIGNYVLINGAFGMPHLGFEGAAISTLLTRVVMLILLFLYLRHSSTFQGAFKALSLKVNFDLTKEILFRSIPGGFQVFFEIGAFSVAIIMMGWISETALAAHQIAINIASTTFMMATGFSFAGGIRIGKAWGKRSIKGIKLAGFSAYFLVFLFMSLCSVLILTFDHFLLELYIDDLEVIKIALPLLAIAAFFQLSDGIQVVGLGVLRGLADIKLPTIITFVAYWVVALPMGYILGFVLGLKSIGIWLGLLAGLSVSAAFLYFRFRKLSKPHALRARFGDEF
ncbi:MAG TPA: MATE family efflux transporter [Leadbetterella sp.]|nr:MATE family efflux transporter [Leadbetterella sp.]